MAKQSAADAVRIIIVESLKQRASVAGHKRAYRALVTLGVTGLDLLRIGGYLDMWDTQGKPYIAGAPEWKP